MLVTPQLLKLLPLKLTNTMQFHHLHVNYINEPSQISKIKMSLSSLFSDDEEFKPSRPCGWGRGTETSQVSFHQKPNIFFF